MKKLTNKERCKKCIHKKVCEYQSYFINTEGIDRCNNYSPKVNKGYRKQSEGEWEIVKGSNGQEKMVCTNCRHGQDLHSTFTYCPNCGARMHGAKMKGGAE